VAGWVLGSAGVLPGWAGAVISVPPRAACVGGDALIAPHGQDVHPEPNRRLHNQRQKGKITFDSKLGGVVDSQTITDAAERHPRAIRDLERRATHAASRPLAQALTDAQTAALRQWTLATRPGHTTPVGDALRTLIDHVRRLIRDAFTGRGRQAQRDAERAAHNAA